MPVPDTLTFTIQNNSDSSNIHAYVTGIAIKHDHKRVILCADGKSLYFPESPSAILQPLTKDVAIPLGAPGKITKLQIPQIAGGRIWFARDGKLTFHLNPGPAIVEPSVLNRSDHNYDVDFCFAEFTLNDDQLFANISYVDFVPRMPVALTLKTKGGRVEHVSGMLPDGLDKVCKGMRAQTTKDKRHWDKLIVNDKSGKPLRVLNPTHADAVGASFDGYFEPLVDAVWKKFKGDTHMKVNTQAGPGVVKGVVNEAGELDIGGEKFQRPTTFDILGCNSGPFTTGPSPARNAIIPRLAAAFQRSCLPDQLDHPSDPKTFFKRSPTNHYCRVVHESNLDGKGYAFAYDDVQPDGGADQSGKVNAGDPDVFIIGIGGKGAYTGDKMPPGV